MGKLLQTSKASNKSIHKQISIYFKSNNCKLQITESCVSDHGNLHIRSLTFVYHEHSYHRPIRQNIDTCIFGTESTELVTQSLTITARIVLGDTVQCQMLGHKEVSTSRSHTNGE